MAWRRDVHFSSRRRHTRLSCDWSSDVCSSDLKNVITRALGMRETVQVDVLAHDIHDQDIFLLCSDGLSGMVEDPKLLELVRDSSTLEAAVASLVDAANQAGGTDNVTVLALQCLNGSNP